MPIGIGLLIAFFLLFIGFYILNRDSFLRIAMGEHRISVDNVVIRKVLEACFKHHFPGQIAISAINYAQENLEIEIILTSREKSVQKELLEAVEKQLRPLLKEQFNYSKPFFLILRGIEKLEI